MYEGECNPISGPFTHFVQPSTLKLVSINLPEPKIILSLVLKRSIIRKTGRYHGTGGSDSVSGDVILELLKPEPS